MGERILRDSKRERIVRDAVTAADRILLDGSDGSVEETDYLTSQVAKRFVEKVDMAVAAKLRCRDLELAPEEHYAIFSPLIDAVVGVCTSQGKMDIATSEPDKLFVSIAKAQFDTFGGDPEDKWTQLEQLGIEKPRKRDRE